MNMTSRPLIQDLVKQALSKDAQRAKIAAEGARQMSLADETSKEASASTDSLDEESVSTDFAMKLAAAVEYATPAIVKAAEGPGAVPPDGVSASQQNQVQPFTPGSQGKGHAQPPTNPGTQASNHGPATQMDNTIDSPPGGTGTQTTAMSGGQGKVASLSDETLTRLVRVAGVKEAGLRNYVGDVAEKVFNKATGKLGDKASSLRKTLEGSSVGSKALDKARSSIQKSMGKSASDETLTLVDHFLASTKVAEDAINPAKISAGAAVPPDTSAAGEPGGAPVAGMPQGPRSLVHSNESAKDYKKGTAYAPRKAELRQYFNEPALTSSTDKTLQMAFAHTGEAGVKISSASQVKTAAARALLKKMAESTAKKAG